MRCVTGCTYACVFASCTCTPNAGNIIFVTMKLLHLSTNGAGVLFLLLELVSSLLPLANSSLNKLDVIRVANTTNDLQQYLCGTNHQQIPNNTVIQLVSPSYVLNASRLCLVSDRHNIGIVSNLIRQPMITCTTKTGLGFVDVNELKINNIQIMNCGAPIVPLADRISTTGPYLPNTSHTSLAIVDSSAVSLSSVTIWEYYGYAILAVNVYGVSNLSQLEIILGNNSWNFDGSGVMVYYHNSSKPASLNIINSNFQFNQLFTSSICFPESLAPLSDANPIPTPYASALSIVYNQVSQNVSVTLNSCYIAFNTGSPVVLILYYDSLPNVTTAIRNGSQITYNQGALSKCHGTGFAMVTYFSKYFAMKYEKSHMSIMNDWTSLSVSQSIINLGMFHYERQSVLYLSTTQIKHLLIHVVFQNVQFQYNSASEVIYAETILTSYDSFKSLAVHFTDVLVDGNILNRVTNDYWYMPGAILTFVDLAAVYLSGTKFTHNVGSVIEAYDTDVYMSGNVSFQHNYGSNGAALLLLGQSYLFLYPNLSANFEYNTYKYGGAIYSFNNKISDNNSYCTFQVLSRNLSEIIEHAPRISFVENSASIGRNYVSAIAIDECQQMQFYIDPSDLYDIIFLFDDDYINEYYSNPARIMPCVKGKPHHNVSNTYYLYPGENIKISLAALDGNGTNIATPVQVQLYHGKNYQSLQPSSDWWLSDFEMEQILDSSAICTNISLTIHTKQVNISHATSTFSFPDDVPTFQSEIILEQCPPGFELDNYTGICDCNSMIKTMNLNFGLDITCDIQDTVVIVPNLDAWIGCYRFRSGQHCEVVGISPSCFPGLCNYSSADSNRWISGSASICIDK